MLCTLLTKSETSDCCNHSKLFRKRFRHSDSCLIETDFDPEDDEPLSVAERLKTTRQIAPKNTTFDEYVDMNENLCQDDTIPTLNSESIVKIVDVQSDDADDEGRIYYKNAQRSFKEH